MRRLFLIFILASIVASAAAPAGLAAPPRTRLFLPAVIQAAAPPAIAGCDIFPIDNIWNTPVDTLPLDANSTAYVNTIGASANAHADFGSGEWEGGPIGIPFTTVPATQPLVGVSFTWDDESDPGPYPIPPDAPIEGGPNSDGDRHVLVLERDHCILYEMYNAWPQANGSWQADAGAKFDLKSHALRPETWTSADAAGLPILPGLVRYDEVASGEIRHAIRFTAPQTRRAYVWPARHYASSLTGVQYPPMGQRFRLKAGVDISGFSPEVQVILRALKRYGMILADNGSAWYISGSPDERWDNDILHELHQIHGSDFEAVNESGLMADRNSGQAVIPPPQISGDGAANTVHLSWQHAAPAEAYEIRRSPAPYPNPGAGLLLATLPASAGSIDYTDVLATGDLDDYYYAVYSRLGGVVSMPSNGIGRMAYGLMR